MAWTSDQLFEHLASLGIDTRTVEHAPVFTVEEARAVRGDFTGAGHIKNLFLRNKKGHMWLVVLPERHPLDLRALGKSLQAGRLSFASPQRLETHLGVIPGAVNPFAVCNDAEGAVKLVLDAALQHEEALWCHPLRNDMTTRIAVDDLLRFTESVGHRVDFAELPRRGG
jgi:Ala-tRNA(Pro) deacylase